MEISNEAIRGYQKIFNKHYGIWLSDDQARDQAIRLLRVFKLIYKPIPDSNGIKLYETKKA